LTNGYWLGTTEVTQKQWKAIMATNPSGFTGDDLPVEMITWDEAMAFCRKLTERDRAARRLPDNYAYMLPTEAQWEYACRAGTTGSYAGDLDKMAWYGGTSGGQTHPVGQKQPNSWGFYDMQGNVAEWCWDHFDNYNGGTVTDPDGPKSGLTRVSRGGHCFDSFTNCISGHRSAFTPIFRSNVQGFRIALTRPLATVR
jgi:formylglycine-generating enzyme required for sulfatase activity